MARLKELAIRGAGDQFLFDPESIEEKPGYNARDMSSESTQAYIRQMADAIHAGGTSAFPPITIFQEDGKVYVRAGHCRRRAHILAKSEGAPIAGIRAIASDIKDQAESDLDLLSSNDQLPLTPLEKAHVIQRLIRFDWTPAEIARRRGQSVTAINNLLALLDAPAEVKQMVAAGEVSATLAVNTVRKEGALLAGPKLKDAVKVAKESGKSKATAKHMPKASNKTTGPLSSNIAWDAWGPKFETAVIDIINAPGHAAQQAAIDRAAQLLEELRG